MSVNLEKDEWYPVYYYDRRWKSGLDVVSMTNAEFVQFTMTQARWERWQAELAWRTGYYTAK